MLLERLKTNAGLTDQEAILSSVDSLKIALLVAAALSLLFFILVQCFPTFANYSIVGAALLSLLTTTILLLTLESSQPLLKTLLVIFFVVLILLIGLSLIRNMQSLRMHAIFLKFATDVVKD